MAIDTASASAVSSDRDGTPVGVWLLICAAMVFSITVLGGLTRLTHSGLSMVTWEPLAGIWPPLSADAWQVEFENYQRFPEYQQINRDMTLAGFKAIFWFEYAHRLLGRAIGAVYALPFAFLLVTRRLSRPLALRLGVLFVLGGLQGLLGWYMVQSGLIERPDVSHLRLTAHLGLAVAIYGYMVWLALTIFLPEPAAWGERLPAGFRAATYAATAAAFVLILSGGLVAGLDAGFVYNTFPKMGGAWVPGGMLAEPLGNLTTVQFLHRWLGLGMAALVILIWGRALDIPVTAQVRGAHHGLLAALAAQGALGIATLLLVVPLPLASLHQGGALAVLAVAIVAAYLTHQGRLLPEPGIRVVP